MANKTGKKGKKPLQTTLGKASVQTEKEVDLSHVQKPINTSIFGLRQVLSLFKTATEEVQNYITYECDIMYECRTCRTIFRSLANFILHKRNYCPERFRQLNLLSNDETSQDSTCLENHHVNDHIDSRPATLEQQQSVSKHVKKDLLPIIEKLKERQEIQQLAQEALDEDLSSTNLTEKAENKNKNNDLLLEQISTNNAAVFQTMIQDSSIQSSSKEECMKSEVMEIHGILGSDEAVLGPDGKICTFATNKVNTNPIIPKGELICTKCNLKFATKKTLTYHIKYKHNNTRLVYICPDCKDSFANAWCVYRHLYKIHRRTSAQIKRMREQIHNSCIRKDQEPIKKKDKASDNVEKTDDENQWLNNIEGDNYFQMCGGCGKRFERKAALNSHAQMCIKRIAVCNSIKENSAKRKEECKENKNKVSKVEKNSPSEVLRGSLKRKPYLLRTYKSSDKDTVKEEVVPPQEVCDVNANCEKPKINCDSDKNKEKPKTNKSVNIPILDSKSPGIIENISSPPSLDGMDTEKMLNIIGVPSISHNVVAKNEEEDMPGFEGFASEENKPYIAHDFDLFCQNIAEQLAVDIPKKKEKHYQKTERTIPLILRRRNSMKSEKLNGVSSLINTNPFLKTSPADKNSDLNKTDKPKNSINKDEKTESQNIENLSSSPFRISVKRLEELTGISNLYHIEESKTPVEIVEKKQLEKASTDLNNKFVLEGSIITEVSDCIRANISPDKYKKQLSKSLKRKRTGSLDYVLPDSLKREGELLSNKKDVNFISKASSYMDQRKLLCIPCDLSYNTLSKLLWHMSAHFSWFRFQCSRCSFISFNKFDCANHARKNHNIKKRSMRSVVLPIPNWKTVLMSHDFRPLEHENDLSGKHTDEIIISGNQEDAVTEYTTENKIEENSDCYDDLFMDSNNLGEVPNDSYCINHNNPPRSNDGIDIVDDIKDFFQIEVPQEIYTLDITEIINDTDIREEERCRTGSAIKSEQVEIGEDVNDSYYILEENEIKAFEKMKIKVKLENKNIEELYTRNHEGSSTMKTDINKISDCTVNVRPTRNRIRSIKTLQDDFFYDLSKVIKLNDSSTNKPTLQKLKKTNSSAQKSSKESASTSSKNETKLLRVYSKRR